MGRGRTWRKLHLGVDETTKEIVAVELTTGGVHDGPHMPAMLDRVADESQSWRFRCLYSTTPRCATRTVRWNSEPLLSCGSLRHVDQELAPHAVWSLC